MNKKQKTIISILLVLAVVVAAYLIAFHRSKTSNTDALSLQKFVEYTDPKLNFSIKLPEFVDSPLEPKKSSVKSGVYVVSNEKNQTAYIVPAVNKPDWMTNDTEEITFQKIMEYEADIRARIKFYPVLKEADIKAAIQDYYVQSNFKLDSWEEVQGDPDSSTFLAYFIDPKTNKKIDIGAYFVMKFSPDKKRVAIWGLGHEPQFVLTDPENLKAVAEFDKEMIKSFTVN